jgi:hypothetical protein
MHTKLYTQVLWFIFCLASHANLNAQTIRFVTPGGANAKNGTDWLNASDNLQAMIDASSAGDQIWVAAGTYKPNAYPTGCSGCSTNKDYAYLLKDGVKIYGGFTAGTNDFSLRNPKTNLTVLSGDLNGDGSIRTYHVVISTNDANTTTLEGFTVSGGGGGSSDYSSVTVDALEITRGVGGGIVTLNSSLSINQCEFKRNVDLRSASASFIKGGSPTFNNCIFIENSAQSSGTINVTNSTPTFNYCFIAKNGGGGIYANALNENCFPTLNFCVVSENYDGFTFFSNASSTPGNFAYCGISVSRSTIFNNLGINFSKYSFYTRESADLYMSQSIVVAPPNKESTSYSNVHNNIVVNDFPENSANNIDSDPLFINPNDPDGPDDTWGTADDGLQLDFCSPAVDAALFGPVEKDILGHNVYNAIGDYGAYERQTPTCGIFKNTSTCQTISLSSVKGNKWYRYFTSDEIAMEIYPNGMDFGDVTISISDPDGSVTYNEATFLGRSLNVTSGIYASGVIMPKSYKLRIYYFDTELTEYISTTSETVTPKDFNMAWHQGGSGCSLESYAGISSGIVNKSGIVNGRFLSENNGFFLEFSLNHFTLFAPTTSGGNPLPVTLVNFTVRNDIEGNILEWTTSSETNNDYFEIERSKNGRNFEKLGEAIAGAGTVKTAQLYSFTDRTFTPGNNYYRLKQVDVDGTVTPSRIIVIQNKLDEILFPNPVHDKLYITNQKKSFVYQIFDLNGKEITRGESSPDTGIAIKDLQSGSYLIKFGNQVLKFVKD